MKPSYSASFLIQAKMPDEAVKAAAALNISNEEFCRRALRFFAAHCVHTTRKPAALPGRRRRSA